MRYIDPQVEYWRQTSDRAAHVARCARICYASEKTTDNERMVAGLEARKHMSMFRHESRYYIVNNIQKLKNKWIIHFLQNEPYVGCYVMDKKVAFISTNGQFVREHEDIFGESLAKYEVSPDYFLLQAKAVKVKAVMMLVRHTLAVTSSIAVTRELNRTSPNAIAEQSTRYVNFGRKHGGITICRSWFDLPMYESEKRMTYRWLRTLPLRLSWHVSDWCYRLALWLGMKPQDARTCLPLEAASRAAYTYNGFEWKHILDLRLRQLTGPAHPDAVIAAKKISDAIQNMFALEGINIQL